MIKTIINNTSGVVDISDVGISIGVSGSYTIEERDYLLWASSENAFALISSGSLIVNDGDLNLPKRIGVALVQDNHQALTEYYTLVQGDDVLIGNGKILHLYDELADLDDVVLVDDDNQDDNLNGLPSPLQLAIIAPVNVSRTNASVGTSQYAARADHKHDIDVATPLSIGSSNVSGTASTLSRSDHIHQGVNSIGLVSNPLYGSVIVSPGSGIELSSLNNNITIAASLRGAIIHSMFEDFLYDDIANAKNTSVFGFVEFTANSGTAVIESGPPTNNAYTGAVLLTVDGTNASSQSGFQGFNAINKIKLGGGDLTLEYRVKLSAQSGTPQFRVYLGLLDGVASGDPANGVYFYYDDTVNSGKWVGVTRANSSSTIVQSSISVAAETWYKLELRVDSVASIVYFLINGVVVGSSTTNITSTNPMRIVFKIERFGTNGSNRSMLIDSVYYRMER